MLWGSLATARLGESHSIFVGRVVMIGLILRWAAILAVGLQVAGCYTDYGPVASAPDPVVPPSSVAPFLQGGEVVRVTIYGEEALTGSYTINPSGEIVMPLIGSVRAAGRSQSELVREITRAYVSGKYIQDPKITVDVLAYTPIYVLGETLRPGAYPYTSGLNVLTAITLAGGFTYRASRTSVLVQHAGETVWQEYPLSASVSVAPGDLIRIPERYF
jgi:protein involved in polysaccharide export with SLBB domain